MNIYETFNNLRYHHEDEVVEFKKAENNFGLWVKLQDKISHDASI